MYDRKVVVFVYGTHVGRVGVTLSVSPSDVDGFRGRVTRFLTQFADQAQTKQIASAVMEKCDELTTFTFLWRRYNVVNYSARLQRFLRLYSAHLVGQEDRLLSEHKMKEEAMFVSLVLDNGPEEPDIDPRRRLQAYKDRYAVASLDVDKEAQRPVSELSGVFDALVGQNGAEPDPRTYLFPEPVYPVPGTGTGSGAIVGAQAAATAPTAAQAAAAASSPTQLPPQQASPPSSPGRARGSSVAVIAAAAAAAAAASPARDASASSSMAVFSAAGAGAPAATSSAALAAPVDLWGAFRAALAAKRVSASDVFFLPDDSFASLMTQVGVSAAHRHLVAAEWRRRGAEALQLTHFAPTDPSFEAVRGELLALTGMQPINMSVLGVVGLRNVEHEASHSARLALMASKAIDRCAYVGEYNMLLRCAERGITAAMSTADAGLCFPRRPFAHMEKPAAVSVMVCDVVVGFQTNAPTAKEAALAKSDTVVVASGSDGASLFVRDVRHVLPRFIVHCHVDPTLVPCPLHPTKQVEYYVVDSQTFACSNCVVLGPHVGRPIVTLDEALQWARTQLNDLLRDAEAVGAGVADMERDMSEQLAAVTGDAALRRKQELIESIRRDAELRAQDAAQQLDAEMAMRADIIGAQRARLAPLAASVAQTARVLQTTARQGNTARAIDVLQSMSQSYDGGDLRAKMGDVRSALAAMPALTTSGRQPWNIASNGAIAGAQQHHGNGSNGGNPAQLNDSLHGRSGSQRGHVLAPSPQQQQQQQQQRSGSEASNHAFTRFMEAASTVAHGRLHSGARTPSAGPPMHGADQSLYNRFVAARGSPASASLGGGNNMSSGSVQRSPSAPPLARPDAGARPQAGTAGRELLQDGWKAFRRGDVATAKALWLTAADRHGNTAVGARAQAYVAEAVDKDAPRAAEWYERALQCDPTDCMTLFNYGVLVEATGHTYRALQLFESAQRLGDVASATRARAIRQAQLASTDY